MLESLPVIARQWSREKFAILTLKPQGMFEYIKRGLFQ